MNSKPKNALISVSDKSQLEKVIKILKKYNITIISSGGTFRHIKKLGYECKEISKFTDFDEMLDGRVKTLHPMIHSGILYDRKKKMHSSQMRKAGY